MVGTDCLLYMSMHAHTHTQTHTHIRHHTLGLDFSPINSHCNPMDLVLLCFSFYRWGNWGLKNYIVCVRRLGLHYRYLENNAFTWYLFTHIFLWSYDSARRKERQEDYEKKKYTHLPILPYCLDLCVFLTTSVALQFRHVVNPWDLWTPLGQAGKHLPLSASHSSAQLISGYSICPEEPYWDWCSASPHAP